MNKAPHHPRPLPAGSAAPANAASAIAPSQGVAPEPSSRPPVRHRSRPVPVLTRTGATGQADDAVVPLSDNNPQGDYPVGYKHPPVHTRFKPGQSGNPKGRPKSSKNFATFVVQELDAKVTIREGGQPKTASKRQLAAKRLVNKAAEGDPKAIQAIIKIDAPATAGAIGPASEARELPDPAAQAERDRELIAMFFAMAREAPDGIPLPVEGSEDGDA